VFRFPITVQTGPGVHPTFYSVGTTGVFTGGKPPGLHSLPLSVEVESEWSYTYAPPCAFAAWTRPPLRSGVYNELGSNSTEHNMQSAAQHSMEHLQKTDKDFLPSLCPRLRKEQCFWEGYQASPVCPYHKSIMQIKMGVERWSNDHDGGKQAYSKKNLSQSHLVHHKSNTNCSGTSGSKTNIHTFLPRTAHTMYPLERFTDIE
jgi:hypothetical protein